jgi:hypothetical protein
VLLLLLLLVVQVTLNRHRLRAYVFSDVCRSDAVVLTWCYNRACFNALSMIRKKQAIS